MKLHYSQTLLVIFKRTLIVSVPYEITLLSNRGWFKSCGMPVSVPYEITLLSNKIVPLIGLVQVSVPYEITLLSNTRSLYL